MQPETEDLQESTTKIGCLIKKAKLEILPQQFLDTGLIVSDMMEWMVL